MSRFKVGDRVVINCAKMEKALGRDSFENINLTDDILRNIMKRKHSFPVVSTSNFNGKDDCQISDRKGPKFSENLGHEVYLYEDWLLPAVGKLEELE